MSGASFGVTGKGCTDGRTASANVPVLQLRLAAGSCRQRLVSRVGRAWWCISARTPSTCRSIPLIPTGGSSEPYFSKLSEWSLNGIRMDGNRGYATLVAVGDSEKFLLLGRTIVPEPTLFGTAFLPVARRNVPLLESPVAGAFAPVAGTRRRDSAYPAGIRLLRHPRGRRSPAALPARPCSRYRTFRRRRAWTRFLHANRRPFRLKTPWPELHEKKFELLAEH